MSAAFVRAVCAVWISTFDTIMEAYANTVQFRFPVGALPPSWSEIAEFVKRMHSDVMQMEVVYKLPQQRSVCVKFNSREAMENALRLNEELIKFYYADGKAVDVHMSTAGNKVAYVRVFDLPPEVPDSTLVSILAEYGKVGNITREKFPEGLGLDHLYTGVRGVYIDITKEIPPCLELSTWKMRIFYDGLKEKCFSCNQEGHYKNSCPKRKPKKTKQKEKQPVSYAAVVECGATTSEACSEVIIEEEIIEEEEIGIGYTTEQQRKEQVEAEQKRERQERAIAELAKVANMFKDHVNRHEASERRAQFAAAGSASTEMLRPKKTARKS